MRTTCIITSDDGKVREEKWWLQRNPEIGNTYYEGNFHITITGIKECVHLIEGGAHKGEKTVELKIFAHERVIPYLKPEG